MKSLYQTLRRKSSKPKRTVTRAFFNYVRAVVGALFYLLCGLAVRGDYRLESCFALTVKVVGCALNSSVEVKP